MLKKRDIEELFNRLAEERPNPKSELDYQDNFQLLIAVILSAQATDVSVNRVTPRLFKIAPTPQKMLDLGEERVQAEIKSIGLSNSKARNIIKCCGQLMEKHKGQVPDNRDDLEKLAGVGQKTAGVVLNVGFGRAEIPVDTHVFRVSNRLGLVKSKTPNDTEKQLRKRVPKAVLNQAHHLLILHGRHVCKARKPECARCILQSICEYPDKDLHP